MPYYRLYHIKQNRFVGVDDFEAEDDTQAMRNAKPARGAEALELWEGRRKIRTFQPEGETA